MPTYTHTELDPFLVRRFRWSVNVLSHSFDAAALNFFERLKHDCPTAIRLVPPWNRQNRFTLAARFADIIRHIENPTMQVARLRRALGVLGATQQDLLGMQTALLDACQESAGALWTEQMETDWRAVLGSVFNLLRADRSRDRRDDSRHRNGAASIVVAAPGRPEELRAQRPGGR